jgi:hypothetical protein
MRKFCLMRSTAIGLAVFGIGMLAAPEPSQAGIFISVRFGPPALPVYVQPLCPGDGYIWTPGYWAYSDLSGYYWVPGTWVLAPQPGYLWTPPYWGYAGGVYGFHPGYWGLHVGFYGGVNYGFGYHGAGFDGGFWDHGAFRYNTAYANVNNTVIHNVYNRTVIIDNSTHVSYNGGPGGINARASVNEMAAERERHLEATSMQAQHEHAAGANRQQWASENRGRPAFASSTRPGEFNHPAPAARPQVNSAAAHPAPVNHTQPVAHAQPQTQIHQQPQAHSQPQAQVQQHQQAPREGHSQAQGGKSGGAPKGEHPEHR